MLFLQSIGNGSLCYLKGFFANFRELPAAKEWIAEGEDSDSFSHVDLSTEAGIGNLRTNGLQIQPPAPYSQVDNAPEGQKVKLPRLTKLDTSEHLRVDGTSANTPSPPRRAKSPLPLMIQRPSQDSPSKASNTSGRLSPGMSLQELCRLQANTPRTSTFAKPASNYNRSQNGIALDDPSVSAAENTMSPDVPGTPRDNSEAEEFIVSCIIPSFLYLGPEPLNVENVQELQDLGIKRILNMALEIDDRPELGLKKKFEKYLKIPMRDFVEETGVAKRISEACSFLGELAAKRSKIFREVNWSR